MNSHFGFLAIPIPHVREELSSTVDFGSTRLSWTHEPCATEFIRAQNLDIAFWCGCARKRDFTIESLVMELKHAAQPTWPCPYFWNSGISLKSLTPMVSLLWWNRNYNLLSLLSARHLHRVARCHVSTGGQLMDMSIQWQVYVRKQWKQTIGPYTDQAERLTIMSQK